MANTPTNRWLLIPTGLTAFLLGFLTFGIISGQLTGEVDAELDQTYRQAFDQGYQRATAEHPHLEVEESSINVLSGHTFFNRLEVEPKTISRSSNAVEFVYGEVGRTRQRETALGVGDSIAYRSGQNIYVITNQSVAANLRRARIEVTRIILPESQPIPTATNTANP